MPLPPLRWNNGGVPISSRAKGCELTAPKRSRGAYSPGLATREAILQAAMRLIASHGYRGFSLRDLGRAVGVSHPAVIYHFPSKEALLYAVIQRYEDALGMFKVTIDESTGALVEHGLTVKTLFDCGVALMRIANMSEGALLRDLGSVLNLEASSPDHPAHAHTSYRYRTLRDFIAAETARLQEGRPLVFPMTADTIAEIIMRQWNGSAIQARYREGDLAHSATVPDFLAFVGHMLDLPSEVIVDIGASLPEDVADVYAMALRRYREMKA